MFLPKFVAVLLIAAIAAFGLDFFGVIDLGPVLDYVTGTGTTSAE